MFSIIIPTWNNRAYIQLCVQSLRVNSHFEHQILLHINDGSDGTLAWAIAEGLQFTHSPDNLGICYAVNRAAMLATQPYVVYLNDDMVCAPGWDLPLVEAVQATAQRLGADAPFMLSGTLIEPINTGNRCVVVADFGRTPDSFDLDKFNRVSPSLKRNDWLGSTWPPTLVTRQLWHEVGGYSSEFSPGMSSDNDFSMKLWHRGCRSFIGVGASLVYHFAKASTTRITKNNGRQQFLSKWGITQSAFDRYYLRRGETITADSALLLSSPAPSFGLAKQQLKARWGRLKTPR